MRMEKQESPAGVAEKKIPMRSCPYCKTMVRSSFRYVDIIKRKFADIELVKRNLLSSRGDSKAFINHLAQRVAHLNKLNSNVTGEGGVSEENSRVLAKALDDIGKKMAPRRFGKKETLPSLGEDDRFLLKGQIDVLEKLFEVINNAPKSTPAPNQPEILRPSQMKPTLLVVLLDRADRLFDLLLSRQRFSAQEYGWFTEEIERLDLIRALFLLQSAPNFQPTNPITCKENKQLEDLLLRNLKKLSDGDKAAAKSWLHEMAKKLNSGLGREVILKTIDPKFNIDFRLITDTGRAYSRGGLPYNRPIGFYRYGFKVKGKFENDQWLEGTSKRADEWSSAPGEWPVSYHGTSFHNGLSIMEEGFQLGKCHRFAYGRGIYSSPNPEVMRKFCVTSF